MSGYVDTSFSRIHMSSLKFILARLVFAIALCSNYGFMIKPRLDPELEGGHFEGDILLSIEQKSALKNPFQRNGITPSSYRWPDGIVYYKISTSFDSFHKVYIRHAMNIIESYTCIQFHEAVWNSVSYVYITNDDRGCYSYIGYQGGIQKMKLEVFPIGSGCFRLGTIIHELLHALGFYHQHSSADRDQYVEVKVENIQDSALHNFRKYSSRVVTNFGVPYDYNSVMHYSAKAFSKNGLDTIMPKNRSAIIGQRVAISSRDVQKINLMYDYGGK